jgi:hypothetical protein
MKVLRILILAAIVTQLLWFLWPQLEYRWLSEDELVVMSYAGLGSSLGIETWMSWANLALTILVFCGLFVFGRKWRVIFLAYFALSSLLLVPFAGLNIETGVSTAMRDVLNLLVGAVIAVAFLSKETHIKDQNSLSGVDA